MKPPVRAWSRREEIANSLSHGAGFVGVLIGTPFLLIAAVDHGRIGPIVGACVFALLAMLLYLISALHHWFLPGKTKDFFEALDHAAIFLMIAGTYTPFALGVLWGPWGWLLMSVIWPFAIIGAWLKTTRRVRRPFFTIALYVAMGWFMLVAVRPLSVRMPMAGLSLILAGGLAYTGGLGFYVARRIPYHHLGWHLSVLAGTAFHYFAVLRYAA